MLSPDYSYYSGVYGGKKIAEGDFARLSAAAMSYLDFVTFGRVNAADTDDALKTAVCRIAEILSEHEKKGPIKSESAGAYKVTYKDLDLQKKLYRTARQSLCSELFYRGLDQC